MRRVNERFGSSHVRFVRRSTGATLNDFTGDHMGFLGFGAKESNIVVVTYEGPNKLRLNGNRKKGKDIDAAKKGATAYEHTVCWIEFSQGGMRLDQGKGPAVAKVGAAEAERILRDLPLNPICKSMLTGLEKGQERAARILSWEDRNATQKPQ